MKSSKKKMRGFATRSFKTLALLALYVALGAGSAATITAIYYQSVIVKYETKAFCLPMPNEADETIRL